MKFVFGSLIGDEIFKLKLVDFSFLLIFQNKKKIEKKKYSLIKVKLKCQTKPKTRG